MTLRSAAAHATMLAGLFAIAPVAKAQVSFTYRDINPSQSSLDATDPDGASGGRVNGIGRATATTFFAATEWGGLYRSTDGGQNWVHLPGHLPVATWDVEVDPANTNRVYATSFYDGRVASLAGINVSTDGGNTWVHPATATPAAGFCLGANRRDNPSAFGIAIDPANSNRVWIGTNCGVALSTDAGVNWAFIDPTPADGADNVWDVAVHDNGIVDVCGDDGHRRSTDGGATWTTATTSPLPSGRCSITVSPDEAVVLFAVVGTAIRESDNGGGSWPNALVNPRAQGRIPFVAVNQRAGASFDLWFGDVQLHRASCTTPATPGAAARCPSNTWTGPFTRTVGGHDDLGDISFAFGVASDACPVMYSSDGGVYLNTTTASPGCHSPTWEQPTTTPHALWLFAMAGADQAGAGAEDLYVGAQDDGSFGTTTAPALLPNWTNRECCDAHNITATAARVVYTICCTATGHFLILRNPGMVGGGAFGTPPPGALIGFTQGDALAHFTASGLVAITTTGVFVTADIAAATPVWTQLGAATTPAGAQLVEVADSSGVPVFFVLAGGGNGVTQDRLFRFTGTGAGAWAQINPPATAGGSGFGLYAVDRISPQRLWASQLRTGLDPQMIRSTDGGATWTVMTALDNLMTGGGTFRYRTTVGPSSFTGFNGYPQPTLLANEPGTDVVTAGAADAGVFLSMDAGISWSLITDPNTPATSGVPHLPRPHYSYIDREGSTFLNDKMHIYVGTQGRGVWRITRNNSRILRICGVTWVRCPLPGMDRGLLVFDCLHLEIERCRFRDPIPRNCLMKFDCPGCAPGALCPPFYHLAFDGMDPEVWEVGLFDRRGNAVDHQLVRTQTGVVLSFRPERREFRERGIGDFSLVFALKPGAKLQRYEVRTSLKVGNEYFGSRPGDGGAILRPADGGPAEVKRD